MIILSCDGITLSFGTDTVLDGISFSLNEGEKLGIVGVNGAGKSSLFRMITGEYEPTSGNIYVSKDKTIGLLEQNAVCESDNTLLDEAYSSFPELLKAEKELEELLEKAKNDKNAASAYALKHEKFTADGGYEFRGRCRGVLKNLGFDERFWEMRASSLSGGQKTRLALACILLKDPDILMLDEPTNHLDSDSLFWLEKTLKSSRKTVLVISHDRYFLDRTVNKVLEIENTHGKLYNGNYTSYASQKAADREIQARHYRNQQREIARIEAYIEQQRRWNRERNIIAAESRQKQLDKMERVAKPDKLPENIRLTFRSAGESGNDVLRVKGLSKSYPGKELFSDVDFLIKKRERVFICGPNGCGKSTLIKILAEKLRPDEGELDYGFNVHVGYYDQENQELDPENTVLDELWNKYPDLTQTELRSALALFQFKGDDIGKKVSVLSGGEKARLTMTKLILSKMNLLILDEPTNHLDIGSREALEKALLEFDGTLIAVSHDRYFINRLATRILDFGAEQKGRLFDFRGGYESYLSYKAEHLSITESTAAVAVTESKERFIQSKQAQAEQRKLERRLRTAKEESRKLEGELESIDEEMNGSAATDANRLVELSAEKEEKENRLLELYELLEKLEKETESGS